MDFKLHIAIDFGTDGIGLAYAYNNNVFVHSKWNSKKYGDKVKPKTIILIDSDEKAVAFGMDAKYSYMTVTAKKDEWMLFDRFKMSLYDTENIPNYNDDEKKQNNDDSTGKIEIKNELMAVNGKTLSSELVFIAAFKHIQKEAKRFLKKKKIKNIKDSEIQWIITVPAIWNDEAKDKMKQWTIKSGLTDKNISNQCKIVYEPDCASLSILHHIMQTSKAPIYSDNDENNNTNDAMKQNEDIKGFEIGEKYILIDAGGGTVDVACHEIIGNFAVKEILHPSGGKWGSCYIDDQYVRLLEEIFGKKYVDEFKKESPNGYVEIINDFQAAKAVFFQNKDDLSHNVRLPSEFLSFIEEKMEEDQDENDEEDVDVEEVVKNCKITGKSDLLELNDEFLKISTMIWQALFDVVMDPIIAHIKKLLNNKVIEHCKYLCLVGGLSCSPYFQNIMNEEFGIKSEYKLKLIIPRRPILSVVEGAAYFGMIKNYIKARVLRYSYGKTIIWPLQRAIQNGIPSGHIEKYKTFNKYANAFGVKGCFMVIARKNQEVKHKQVFTSESSMFDPNSNFITINILCSDKENPKIKDDGWRIAELKLNINDNDQSVKEVKIITEFHFYDTTLHVFAYRSRSPNIKQEIELNYANINAMNK